jgi:hypothetical protein
MSYEFAYRFWYFASDNGGRSRRVVQIQAPDYPAGRGSSSPRARAAPAP